METLFRGNTPSSRILKYFFKFVGDQFLKDIMEKVLATIIAENKPMEIFPTKISAEGEKQVTCLIDFSHTAC